MATKKRYTKEEAQELVKNIETAQTPEGGDMNFGEACKKFGIATGTYYKWKNGKAGKSKKKKVKTSAISQAPQTFMPSDIKGQITTILSMKLADNKKLSMIDTVLG